jgi:4Fe-4S single cluster domain
VIPSPTTLREALCAGHWDTLDDLANTAVSYQAKAELGLVAAEEAALLLARDPDARPEIQRHFCVDGSQILISPAGTGVETSGGPASVLAVSADDGAVRIQPVWDGDDVWTVTQRLAARHGWALPADRVDRFHRRTEGLIGFHGLGRFEFRSLLHSPEGRVLGGSAAELADVVYPLWRPRALGLTLTYRCNAACAHCYNVSGPKRSADCLGWSQTGDHLREWVQLGVTDIGISGGEPFLYPDLVVDMVAELKSLGVPLVSPFTNGFWGNDETAARDLLIRLRRAGFGDSSADQVKISSGEFHIPFVPASDVLTVAALHHEIIGNPVVLDVELIRTDEELRNLVAEAKRRGIHDRIQWMARPAVSDSGRAKRWYDTLPQQQRPLAELRCPIKASASLYPAGDWVYCSGTSWPVDYRRIGNLDGNGPYGIAAATQRDPRVPYWQFGTFADWARDHRADLDGELVVMPVQATVCGTCRDLFGPPRVARKPRPVTLSGAR